MLAIAAFAAAPACADIPMSATTYVGGSVPLSIPVTASVGGRCRFASGGAPSGTWDAGAIDTTDWTHDFSFTIDCNTASRVAVVSANGGLKNAGSASTGYVNLAPYTVALNLDGNSTTASQSCSAADLAASATSTCTMRGPASTIAGLRLAGPSQDRVNSYVRVSAPGYAGTAAGATTTLISGDYADILTITIAAAP